MEEKCCIGRIGKLAKESLTNAAMEDANRFAGREEVLSAAKTVPMMLITLSGARSAGMTD